MPEEDKIKLQRAEDFEALYANNIQFETSVWDLKLIFGQLDQGKSCVEQHTAITLPWVHAKIAAYYFLLNLVFQQAIEGPINVPARVVPPRPDPSAPDVEVAAKPTLEYLAWLHDQFFGSNPYVPPNVAAVQNAPAAGAP
ncbi:MAG: hypothetical protein ABSH05_15880 [Bryobacteraceae bacterium]|jgi:hypothetical protein